MDSDLEMEDLDQLELSIAEANYDNKEEIKSLLSNLIATIKKQSETMKSNENRRNETEVQVKKVNNNYVLEKRLSKVERYANRPFLLFVNPDVAQDGSTLQFLLH